MLSRFKIFAVTLMLLSAAGVASTRAQEVNADYQELWSRIDALEAEGLPRSANDILDGIIQRARADSNAPQLLKALMYRSKYVAALQEDEINSIVREFRVEIGRADGPTAAVLHSILGEVYWRYYQANRYRYLDRTAVSGMESGDVEEWDGHRIVAEALGEFRASLTDIPMLAGIPVARYAPLLQNQRTDRYLRPTLFDFLAHRALEVLRNTETGLATPVSLFQMTDPLFLGEATAFVDVPVSSSDSLSTDYLSVQLYQQLLRRHLDDDDPSALVTADLERLAFVREAGSIPDEDRLYEESLRSLGQRYEEHPIGTDVSFALASLVAAEGNSYKSFTNEEGRWKLKEAHDMCAAATARFPDSFGAANCSALQTTIEAKAVRFDIEESVEPDTPFRVRLEYRNVSKVFVAVVRVSRDELLRMPFLPYQEREEFEEELFSRPRVLSTSFDLPADTDYQSHSTELPIRSIDKGLYVVIAGTDPGFSKSGEARGYSPFGVTALGMVRRSRPDGRLEVRVLDRDSGRPVEGAEVMAWAIEYRNDRRFPERKSTTFTDAEGLAVVSHADNSFLLFVRKGVDQIVSTQWHYAWRGHASSQARVSASHFFTDRAIYRPGQPIFFKGILLSREDDRYEVRASARTTVQLLDINGREIASLDLTSNSYGTVKGQFAAPSGAGTGEMRIRDGHGSVSFSVEEYKRPRFEVDFDSVATEIELGEDVTVHGFARAFSGAPVDRAAVRYRVVRKPVFPPWFYWWRFPPETNEAEIASGVTETDIRGSFDVTFRARPDEQIDRESNPLFKFEVIADVTDAGGETQSGSFSVRVGYTSLVIGIQVPDKLSREQPEPIQVLSENVEGSFLRASGKIRISRLQKPARLLRSRSWPRVDRPVISKQEFRVTYPMDIYADEDDPRTWAVDDVVLERTFDTGESDVIDVRGLEQWQPGKYHFEVESSDSKGRVVRSDRFVTVYSEKDRRPPLREILWIAPVKISGEPGDVAQILVGSGADDTVVIVEVERRVGVTERRRLNLSRSQQMLRFPITWEDRGNFAVHFTLVRHGRVFIHTETIRVPYTDRQLSLKLETFRDQLYPGQEEEWRIKVSGPQGEPVVAEMLAAMYDASLDQFVEHAWPFGLYGARSPRFSWTRGDLWGTRSGTLSGSGWNEGRSFRQRRWDRLNWFGLDRYLSYPAVFVGAARSVVAEGAMRPDAAMDLEEGELGKMQEAPSERDNQDAGRVKASSPVRTNFSETAFFLPDLVTNESGETILKFTIPEALTRWRMLGLAHTADVRFGTLEAETVTRKDLMITANAPRFLREGDNLRFAASVQNLSERPLSGTARLELYDTKTMALIDSVFANSAPTADFSLAPGLSQALRWSIVVPEGYDMVTYRVVADAGEHSDGEQKPLPVLTNRMLVTESLPLPMRGPGTRTFTFKKLAESTSPTLRHHALTLEFTPNPVWYAVQALPYMMEFPHECSEQVFSRLYANSIAAHIVERNPRIEQVFNRWKDLEAGALQSNLEKNAELKAIILEETPWLRAAQDESERKRRIGVLFDFARMSQERDRAVRRLVEVQYPYGAWPWFDGMPPSRYVTQHIVAGFGHMRKLGVYESGANADLAASLASAVSYLDTQIQKDYQELLDSKVDLRARHISRLQIHYLYARSFFPELSVSAQAQPAVDYYMGQAQKYWLDNDIYARGMIALALHRTGDSQVPPRVIRSLREFALQSDELGMYWKYPGGYYWYEAPIETQALLIEAFDEIANDSISVADMQLWLLKQKQTQDWKTTKATTEAVYALLMRGTRLIDEEGTVSIQVGDQVVDSESARGGEPGTGYLTAAWEGPDIVPEMAQVEVTKTGPGPAWGALYWQYFEQLDRITPAETPLSIEKALLRERLTDAGPVIEPFSDEDPLAPGDKLVVRVTIRVDRDMEYVHLKDMRASGLEPINVLSTYRFQDGLGYYESTRDAATHFFIGYLPKGTFVFEHPLRVNLGGDFSNGITSIQSMYAPEFAAHSGGVRLLIREK